MAGEGPPSTSFLAACCKVVGGGPSPAMTRWRHQWINPSDRWYKPRFFFVLPCCEFQTDPLADCGMPDPTSMTVDSSKAAISFAVASRWCGWRGGNGNGTSFRGQGTHRSARWHADHLATADRDGRRARAA